MNQRQSIFRNNGLATQSGDIIVCNGAAECPLAGAVVPESKRIADFYTNTGIWAPSGARDVLERLMSDHGFTPPDLKAAWQENNLVWRQNENKLDVRTYWIEPVFGYGVWLFIGLFFLGESLLLILYPPQEGWRALAVFCLSMVPLSYSMWTAGRFVIKPYRVAKKVRAALESAGEEQ